MFSPMRLIAHFISYLRALFGQRATHTMHCIASTRIGQIITTAATAALPQAAQLLSSSSIDTKCFFPPLTTQGRRLSLLKGAEKEEGFKV